MKCAVITLSIFHMARLLMGGWERRLACAANCLVVPIEALWVPRSSKTTALARRLDIREEFAF